MWKIVTWSRAEGRGEVESDHFGPLVFDAGVADVDDFLVGEDVWAEIDSNESPRVTRVWPEDARYRGPRPPSRAAPGLAQGLSMEIGGPLRRLEGPASTWMRLESVEGGAAVFTFVNELETTEATLRIEDFVFLAVPATTQFYGLRLATDTERDHVHENLVELAEDTAVLVHRRHPGAGLIVGRGITVSILGESRGTRQDCGG